MNKIIKLENDICIIHSSTHIFECQRIYKQFEETEIEELNYFDLVKFLRFHFNSFSVKEI